MKNEGNINYKGLVIKDETKNKQPAFYQVSLHNDDFTPMEFVVDILERFFFMSRLIAARKMLEAHISGKVACGIYSKEVAQTKVSQVVEYARCHEHPLICSMEVAYE